MDITMNTKAIKRVACSLFAVLLSVGCSTVKDKSFEEHSHRQYHERVVRDSIFCRDSIVVRNTTDTVYVMRERTLYRDRLRVDTLWRCDTIYRDVVKEVFPIGDNSTADEKKESGFWYMVLAVVLFFILWRSGLIGFIINLFSKRNA